MAKRAALEKQRAAQGLGPEGQAAERTLQATAAEIEANKRCVAASSHIISGLSRFSHCARHGICLSLFTFSVNLLICARRGCSKCVLMHASACVQGS